MKAAPRTGVPAGLAALLVIMSLCTSIGSAAPIGAAETGLLPNYLRCEYLVDPLGIAAASPRLSWIVESPMRGQRQTAYRILVAGSEALLQQDRGDLWDSGKVESDETAAVSYAGKPLPSHQRCYWKVRVWDRDGAPSSWSRSATWSMGLLQPEDWNSEWIGYDQARTEPAADADFGAAQWIGHAADRPLKSPRGQRIFLATLQLPESAGIEKADLILSGDDNARLSINGELAAIGSPGGTEIVQYREVGRWLRPGDNEIRAEVGNGKPGPAGLIARLAVRTRDGRNITLVTDGQWKSTASPGSDWMRKPLDAKLLNPVRLLGPHGMKPWGRLKSPEPFTPPACLLRAAFRTEKPLLRATLSATALGIFDIHINGARVSDDYFNPGWTDYTKRVYYRTFDVTRLIRPGENAWGALLADGWYSGYIGYQRQRNHYGRLPRLRAQILLEYADGTRSVVGTNTHWKAAIGPIRQADFLMGETYDSRAEIPGWDQPGFDDRSWAAATTGASEVQPVIQSHPGPPVRAFTEIRPVATTQPLPGVYVLNLGQNFAGVVRLKVAGERGQTITLRFAERLNPDGTIYTLNLREARVMDTYICRGGGTETWQPRFTFHGFQYVEISGLRQPPAADTVTGIALSSDTPVAGSFESSDEMLNRLHRNIYFTQRANFIDIPTDCPQRDERLGWTGDAQVYARAATLNADVQAFFTKWLIDLEDGQRKDGQFPMVAPVKVAGSDGGPAWADAGVIVPWTMYEVYGDRSLLESHYDSMTRFIAFCQQRSRRNLLPPAKYHAFGDWLSIKADTPKDIIYTAYFARSTQLTAQAAAALGKAEEAARYEQLFRQIKAAFNRAYVSKEGRIKGDTQTGYVLALAFDLLDGRRREQAAHHLISNIESRGGHLSTGFIGTKDLMLVLTGIGRTDVAYGLLHNETFPSWGFSIKQGATSIWERWDGWTPEQGFQDPGMNSFAHYSFGAVYQWMVENIGGIRNDGPGYRKIVIAPQPDRRLSWARTSYRTIRGEISTHWSRANGEFSLEAIIPANTTATLLLPAARADAVTENGHPLEQSAGVKLLRMGKDHAVLAVESGHYRFQVKP